MTWLYFFNNRIELSDSKTTVINNQLIVNEKLPYSKQSIILSIKQIPIPIFVILEV